MKSLEGKVAIVTGASSGIGKATAFALAEAGAFVTAAARREDRLAELQTRIEAIGGQCLTQVTDVAELEQVEAMAAATRERFGRIDILVNNAGVMPVSPLSDGRVEDWTRMIDVNIKGVLHGVAAVLPTLIEQESGHIVTIGSVAGRRPFPGGSVYAATKFAVRALSWGMHLELGANHNIRVTDIQPAYVSTELLSTVPDVAMREGWEKGWEGKRPLQPEDVAQTVLFAVTCPDHVSVSELLVRSVDQAT